MKTLAEALQEVMQELQKRMQNDTTRKSASVEKPKTDDK